MKNFEMLKTTGNSSVYRKAFIKLYSKCPMCSPNRGCNRHFSTDINSWKRKRLTQWR